jgi:hypothetical protein
MTTPPTDAVTRVEADGLDLSGETYLGMRVAAWMGEKPSGFTAPSSTTIATYADHWSTIPAHENPKRLFSEDDVRPRLCALQEGVASLKAERDQAREHLEAIAEMVGESDDVGATWESVQAVIDERDALSARVRALEVALKPFAESAAHLHPSHPDDGLTLDHVEVCLWRRAAQALAGGA